MVSFDASAVGPAKESFDAAVREATVVESCLMDSEWASMATCRRGQRSMLMPLR